jgi:hypothetical protein
MKFLFCFLQAIDMYNTAGMWEEAHHLASRYMDPTEVILFHFKDWKD